MPLSVRLSEEEEALLEAASRQTAQSKSDLARQGIREVCERLLRPERTPFELGADLFGAGQLAPPPVDPRKRAVWERLRAKHRRVG